MPVMRASAAVMRSVSRQPEKMEVPVVKSNRMEEKRNSNFSLRRGSNFERKSVLSNSNRSSISSTGCDQKVKISLRIRSSSGDVVFKQDGGRFDAQQTLKLATASDYTLKMETKPAMELLFVRIAGVDYSFTQLNSTDDVERSVFEFVWSTSGIDATMRRHRADVPCSIKFKSFKELDFNLQVKFYLLNSGKHIAWGQKLNSVVLDCTAGRGSFTSTVDAVKFF